MFVLLNACFRQFLKSVFFEGLQIISARIDLDLKRCIYVKRPFLFRQKLVF